MTFTSFSFCFSRSMRGSAQTRKSRPPWYIDSGGNRSSNQRSRVSSRVHFLSANPPLPHHLDEVRRQFQSRESQQTAHQKILAELTGVGVKRNIFVFRRINLDRGSAQSTYLASQTHQFVSVHENKKANMVLREVSRCNTVGHRQRTIP
jgi:hypothetical protein